MVCKHCGTQNPDSSTFCQGCGAKLGGSGTAGSNGAGGNNSYGGNTAGFNGSTGGYAGNNGGFQGGGQSVSGEEKAGIPGKVTEETGRAKSRRADGNVCGGRRRGPSQRELSVEKGAAE